MPLGLGPGDLVLDEDPAHPKKEHSTPNFRPMSTVDERSPISATAEHLFKLYNGPQRARICMQSKN